MRTNRIVFAVALVATLAVFGIRSASAAIEARLEAPDGSASQIANIQGWAYTTTPGAELVQPFDVFINGEKVQEVPCCSDRGDVQDVHPDAPLRTGFSGVINWSRPALEVEGPISLKVVIRDTTGEEVTLAKIVDLYPVASFPFARNVAFAMPEVDGLLRPAAGPAPGEEWVIPEHRLDARCVLSNVMPAGGHDMAQLACRNLAAFAGDGTRETCEGEIRFRWDRGSQGFKQISACEEVPRWTDHGNGTATDHDTGLMWELKTGQPDEELFECRGEENDPEPCSDPHDVRNRYDWARVAESGHDGSAFLLFLSQLNDGERDGDDVTRGCHAGYCDWRLPTIDELETLVAECEDGLPCTDIPGATARYYYWSQTRSGDPTKAWDVQFDSGTSVESKKDFFDHVRAVRGTAKCQASNDLILLEFE